MTVTVRKVDDPAPTPSLPAPEDCSVLGTKGDDVLERTDGADAFCDFGGNDTIKGGKGKDTIYGGPRDGGSGASDGQRDEIDSDRGKDSCEASEEDAEKNC